MEQSKKRNYKIVMTGGHAATTAASVYESIIKLDKEAGVYFLGSKYAIEGKKIPTLEYELLPSLGIKFIPIISGRLQRKFTKHTITSLLKIPIGLIHSFFVIAKLKPHIILSFGGYTSFPVVLWGYVFGVPVVIHEQTAAAGRANLFASGFASKIALSRKESLKYFPKEKSLITGNPVSDAFIKIPKKLKLNKVPVILVTGGSRGSQTINNVIGTILPKLLKKYKVIHITGELDWESYKKLQNNYGEYSQNYTPMPKVTPPQMADLYAKSDLIIARSGANTVSEIAVTGRPAILIPLPISYLDEQTKNAQILKNTGLANIINQKDLTETKLLGAIEDVFDNYELIINKALQTTSVDNEASDRLATLLYGFLND